MIRKLLLVGAIALAGVIALPAAFSASAQEGGPPPPPGASSLASGLSATGSTVGPDGALYIPIGGTANITIPVPAEFVELAGTDTAYFGTTGSVARVDVETGEVTTYAEGLPVSSFGTPEEGSGPTDATFMGDTLYVLVTGGANYLGAEATNYPNGIYRLNPDDSWTVIADLSEFNDENPVDFPDAGPGGNPFAISVRGSDFIVSDGNYNRLLTVTTSGAISIFAEFDNVVPTGLETPAGGPVWNTWFSPFPHDPGTSFLQSVGYPTGTVTTVADEWTQLIDVKIGPGGNVYVLQFGDQQLDENAPPPPGRLLLLQDGALLPVVEGFTLSTSLSFIGDTAYVTSLTGEVWEVPGVSGLTPVEPEPTTAPPPPASPTAPVGTVLPPDTGSGGDAAAAATPWVAVLLLAAASATCFALVKVTSRG